MFYVDIFYICFQSVNSSVTPVLRAFQHKCSAEAEKCCRETAVVLRIIADRWGQQASHRQYLMIKEK